ncbi:MAG TPA: hypothetical protein VMZ31_04625 [Phycisphaerae bacterium]|nr:hypothetical protein [Phycisphaerae bacterium]
MDLVSAVVNFSAALALSQVQYAVAAKILDVADQQGQAAVELIEAAAEMMDQATTDMLGAAEQLGASLDVMA